MTAPDSSVPTDALADRIEDTKQRLAREFQSVVSIQAIEEATRQSLAHYGNVRVPDFVPLFVERETRERLQAQLR